MICHVLKLCEKCEGLYTRHAWFTKNSMLVDELASALHECTTHAEAFPSIIRSIHN